MPFEPEKRLQSLSCRGSPSRRDARGERGGSASLGSLSRGASYAEKGGGGGEDLETCPNQGKETARNERLPHVRKEELFLAPSQGGKESESVLRRGRKETNYFCWTTIQEESNIEERGGVLACPRAAAWGSQRKSDRVPVQRQFRRIVAFRQRRPEQNKRGGARNQLLLAERKNSRTSNSRYSPGAQKKKKGGRTSPLYATAAKEGGGRRRLYLYSRARSRGKGRSGLKPRNEEGKGDSSHHPLFMSERKASEKRGEKRSLSTSKITHSIPRRPKGEKRGRKITFSQRLARRLYRGTSKKRGKEKQHEGGVTY